MPTNRRGTPPPGDPTKEIPPQAKPRLSGDGDDEAISMVPMPTPAQQQVHVRRSHGTVQTGDGDGGVKGRATALKK